MPLGINPLTFALGHQWGTMNPQREAIGEHLNMRANIAKVLGYLPGISIFVGIFRILGLFEKEKYKLYYPTLALTNKHEEDAITLRVALRGIAEILSFTFLLLLLDITADLIRINHYESKNRNI